MTRYQRERERLEWFRIAERKCTIEGNTEMAKVWGRFGRHMELKISRMTVKEAEALATVENLKTEIQTIIMDRKTMKAFGVNDCRAVCARCKR